MATLIKVPVTIPNVGTGKKLIEEFFGNVSTKQPNFSLAAMTAESGWEEPGQIAEFDEYVYVYKGIIFVKTLNDEYRVHRGQAILINKGEWVQFSNPYMFATQYVAICVPAFSPKLVKRDK
jgi:quercetin dioxygenase-like cupin family protein